MTFDEWYATQKHQLANEQVCRVIWEAAARAENEACAKVFESFEAKADALNNSIEYSEEWRSDYVIGKAQAANAIAKAIRERMNHG